jgi:hypothetical protein
MCLVPEVLFVLLVAVQDSVHSASSAVCVAGRSAGQCS